MDSEMGPDEGTLKFMPESDALATMADEKFRSFFSCAASGVLDALEGREVGVSGGATTAVADVSGDRETGPGVFDRRPVPSAFVANSTGDNAAKTVSNSAPPVHPCVAAVPNSHGGEMDSPEGKGKRRQQSALDDLLLDLGLEDIKDGETPPLQFMSAEDSTATMKDEKFSRFFSRASEGILANLENNSGRDA
eukprot:Rmarinus@m.9769